VTLPTRVSTLLLFATLSLVAGCSSTLREETWARFSELPPLPYSLHIEPVSVGAEGDLEELVQYRTRVELRTALTEALREGFSRSEVFTAVSFAALKPGDDDHGSEPPGEASSDLVLRAKVRLLKPRGLPVEDVHGHTAAATGLVWFLSRVPGWFIADRSYEPMIRVSIEASQAGSRVRAHRVFDSGKIPLTFNERSAFGQYALQFIFPCGLVPANTEVTRKSLLEKSIEEIQFQVVSYFKEDFGREGIAKSQPFLIIPVDPLRGENGVIVLLPGEMVDFKVDGGYPDCVMNPSAIDGYLRSARQKDARRIACFARVQRYFSLLTPERAIPSLGELARAYSHVYVFENIVSGLRERHIEISYRVYADLAPVAATWTIPST